jgi:hypothetical protein
MLYERLTIVHLGSYGCLLVLNCYCNNSCLKISITSIGILHTELLMQNCRFICSFYSVIVMI